MYSHSHLVYIENHCFSTDVVTVEVDTVCVRHSKKMEEDTKREKKKWHVVTSLRKRSIKKEEQTLLKADWGWLNGP